ncbi:MAG: ferrous iron transport protein A [Alphaproteobacteria bacterium]
MSFNSQDVPADVGGPAPVTLAEVTPGRRASVVDVVGDSQLKRRLSALGIGPGTEVILDYSPSFDGSRVFSLRGYQISLRNEDARKILLVPA